jgi:cell division protein FtsL
MIKLLLCILCAAALALLTLHLRHEQLELSYENAELHEQIKAQQAMLWNQQLQIAVYTAPNAISQTVNSQKLNLVPEE